MIPSVTIAASQSYLFGALLYAALWIVVMVWIYNIAKRKGRHPLGWVFLAFFFFLLALIVLLLLPSKRTTASSGRP